MAGKDEERGGAGHCLGVADFKTLNFFLDQFYYVMCM